MTTKTLRPADALAQLDTIRAARMTLLDARPIDRPALVANYESEADIWENVPAGEITDDALRTLFVQAKVRTESLMRARAASWEE